jgi:LuxR family maltose regulon positive regulatory protein
MRSPLLETKLYIPKPRRTLVPRPRLIERLDRGSASTLTLLSAPAGFGKTTLLAAWLAAGATSPATPRPAAWLSLDPGDNDPGTFWAYVIAALRTAAPGVGAGAGQLLETSHPAPVHDVLTALLNDLGSLGHDLVLVLDDYHVIESPDVQDGMTFFLDHLPGQVHVVIAGRADPAVPLARFRARGELVEARAADLRFTTDEAGAYLTDVMGLPLTARDVSALEERTEGWIAALQLAALSMQGRDDVAGFIAGFAGDDRYIVDYLVEEVVQRQPDQVRTFLLQTSILTRLTGSLCDAVTGRDGGRTMLETLERGNLFLIPLDDRRRWYRYHHLFADVMQTRLLDEQPDQVAGLHRRASVWYAEHGEQSVAVHHALAAGDAGRAADLIELAMPAMRRDRREATLRGWLEMLPDDLFAVRPVLSNGCAGALLATGEVAGVEARLRDAERWLEADNGAGPQSPPTGMVVVDDAEFRRLPGSIAVHRAGQALMLGDPSTTVTHARRALDLLQEGDHLGHGAAAALIGIASWASGDLDEAHEAYADCMAGMQRAGHLSDVLGCAITLADIRIVQGRLGEAMRTYEEALRLAPGPGGSVLRGTADMYVGMSALHRERGDLNAATQHLLRSQELGEHNGLPQNRYRWRVAMARIREAEGDLSGALDLLDEAERRYVGDFAPDVRPVRAARARVRIRQGRLGDAFGWARERGLSVSDELSYLREFEHVTLARACLARYGIERTQRSFDELTTFLDRLLHAAETGRRTGSVLEILVLTALAHQLRGDLAAALRSLEGALVPAEPEGYVRLFVDEGAPMAVLLTAAAKRGIVPRYARRLITAFGRTGAGTPTAGDLVEPLSARERDVLRLLATDLSGPDIARELIVSLSTVRTHTNRIFAKLGVNNRRAAVRRAGELGLLSREQHRKA